MDGGLTQLRIVFFSRSFSLILSKKIPYGKNLNFF